MRLIWFSLFYCRVDCANNLYKKDGYRQQNVRQWQKLISIIDYGVFAAILQIFNVKEWPDLEIWVRGSSRSLKNAR